MKSIMFGELDMDLVSIEEGQHAELGGYHGVFKFSNGWGGSVIQHLYSYGGREGLFELAVLDRDGDLCYSTPITSDVLGYLKPEEVIENLKKISELK